ncbi:hypothetical protein ACRE_015750 [Hapsidospora chrysogenum ATCC 11550]|uniref:Uncharacterized protein n=1 Tax=Hapsidospora chrysogenum (strain ATCC 11550 / CBS 779.69 / DSM 880 / IAM 14645 / JCM 23072 / IMI 49137) TaxID=857340 RepID=A0A086TE03_HAPC1|nr:hypothetical protein ACRE_015750 [Hapsidospora chrysogenum ATCC 11550]
MATETTVMERAPALPVKSDLRSSRFLEPIDSKADLDSDQPPLSPATAPHDIYLSSEEDASSSADDFSDYDFESDSEFPPDSPERRKSHEDTARVVSFIFYGKPSIVQLPPREKTVEPVDERHGILRTATEPVLRRTSVSSIASSSILSTISRSSTIISSGYTRQKPAFLSIDPYASRTDVNESPHEGTDRPPTPRGGAGGSSMLKRTFSLARKRSKPALNRAAAVTDFQDSLPLRSASVDHSDENVQEHVVLKRRARHQDVMQAARNSTVLTKPPPPVVEMTEAKSGPTQKGHSRLRSGLSISMSRRKS